MVDKVATSQILVLFRQLDPESQASLLISMADAMDDTYCGVPIDEERYALSMAADKLYDVIQKCPDVARLRYDPDAARADRAYEANKDERSQYGA